MRNQFLLALLILLALTLSACVSLAEDVTPPPNYQPPTALQSTAAPSSPVYPMVAPDPARGALLYSEKCQACHGESGLGDGRDASALSVPVPPLGDPALARLAVPSDWYNMVTNGNLERFMPPFRSLSASERWDVIAYAYSLSMPAEMLAQGEQLYVENCAACHGESGQGDGPQSATLADSPVDFTDQAFMGARSQAHLYDAITLGSGGMHAFTEFNDDQVWALTAFLRSLTFAETVNADVSTMVQTPDVTEEVPELPLEETGTSPETNLTAAGTVRVDIVHGEGGELPENLEVVLRAFDGMTEVFSNSLSLPADGVVVFENVELPAQRVVFATITYDSALYGSDIAQVTAGTEVVNLQIVYYEPTTDTSLLSADRLHVFFDFLPGDMLQVYMLYIFTNDSSQVVVPDGDQPTLTFALPQGATDLRVQESMQLVYVEVPEGFGVTSIYPSSEPYQVMYSFSYPYQRDKAEIELPIAMDTSASILMVPEEGVRIRSEQLQESGVRDMQGVTYSTFNSGRLQAGESLLFSISGQPKGGTDLITAGGEEGHLGLVIGLGVFGLALIGVGIYLWRRNQLVTPDYDELEDDPLESLELSSDPGILMDEIIALDDLYQAGELEDEQYRQRREALKARLEDVLGAE